jgi:hypothetical protein
MKTIKERLGEFYERNGWDIFELLTQDRQDLADELLRVVEKEGNTLQAVKIPFETVEGQQNFISAEHVKLAFANLRETIIREVSNNNHAN